MTLCYLPCRILYVAKFINLFLVILDFVISWGKSLTFFGVIRESSHFFFYYFHGFVSFFLSNFDSMEFILMCSAKYGSSFVLQWLLTCFNARYEEIDILPRWFWILSEYCGMEWFTRVLSLDGFHLLSPHPAEVSKVHLRLLVSVSGKSDPKCFLCSFICISSISQISSNN